MSEDGNTLSEEVVEPVTRDFGNGSETSVKEGLGIVDADSGQRGGPKAWNQAVPGMWPQSIPGVPLGDVGSHKTPSTAQNQG